MAHVLTAEVSSSRREDKDDNSNDKNRSRPSAQTLKGLVQIMITSGLILRISNHRAAIHYKRFEMFKTYSHHLLDLKTVILQLEEK